jgi:hypothetical protein
MLLRTLFILVLVAGMAFAAQAQQPEKPARPPRASASGAQDKTPPRQESKIMVGTPEAEMMARHEVNTAEKDHKENLERAREAAQLSTEIRDSFLHNKAFGRTEEKKLERLEKLTRKIRSEAGGSDGEVTIEAVPSQMGPALARLAEISDKMRKVVEKTPRQVISASVIERANELLEIIRYVKNFTR